MYHGLLRRYARIMGNSGDEIDTMLTARLLQSTQLKLFRFHSDLYIANIAASYALRRQRRMSALIHCVLLVQKAPTTIIPPFLVRAN